MRFTIKHVGCSSERVGSLSGFLKSSGIVIETPTTALATQGASVVHLTADVLAKVFPNPQLLWVPLSNAIQLEKGVEAQGKGLANFAALPDHVVCTTLHAVSEMTPAGHFEMDKVPLWTKNGKKMFTADKYMSVMKVFKPDLILAIADGRTSLSEGPKRMTKSVERTNNMLDVCVLQYKNCEMLQSSSLIGVIVGTASDNKCEDSIKHILKYKDYITGVALAGMTDGSEDITEVPLEILETVFKRVDEALPKDLVRIIEGCWNPAVVVAAIGLGWDVFDGSYPLKLTNAGHVLVLNYKIKQKSTEHCILDLNHKKYKEDFKPVLEGCECLCCKKHSRAYIRHLLNTREMLATVLLSIHNLHHFDQLFHHARLYIKTGSFNDFKEHITNQYNLYKTSLTSPVIIGKSDKETVVDLNDVEQVEQAQEVEETGNTGESQQRKKFRMKHFAHYVKIVAIAGCIRLASISLTICLIFILFAIIYYIFLFLFMILIKTLE